MEFPGPELARRPSDTVDRTPAAAGDRRQRLRFAVRVIRADLSNFLLLQYRRVDAFLISGKNSGTHWVKYMLSCAIAHQYGVPAPAKASGRAADAIIGHPRWKPAHPGLPYLGSTHTIPSIAFSWRWRLFDHPPVVILVRDIREALLSNYVKWQQSYDASLTEYLRGDPSGRRFVADIWWYIHFFNRWGDVARARPGRVLIVRYEDVRTAPAFWIRRMAEHMGVSLSDAAVAAALPYVDRAAVQARLDPAYGETIIPERAERETARLTAAQDSLLDSLLGRHLRHTLGYDYPVRPRRRSPPPPPLPLSSPAGAHLAR